MKMQFFTRCFSVFILISPVIRAKQHTAVPDDYVHGMPRFHIISAQDGDFVTNANILNLFSVAHEYDGQTDGQATFSNSVL